MNKEEIVEKIIDTISIVISILIMLPIVYLFVYSFVNILYYGNIINYGVSEFSLFVISLCLSSFIEALFIFFYDDDDDKEF